MNKITKISLLIFGIAAGISFFIMIGSMIYSIAGGSYNVEKIIPLSGLFAVASLACCLITGIIEMFLQKLYE